MHHADRIAGRARALLTIVALLAVAPAIEARADAVRDVYTVVGVPVDATAANALQARDQAIAAGQLNAARLLLERLALRRDYPRLPQITREQLPALVEGFEVANERTSAVRYLADLTVAFKPQAVRTLMQDAGVPVADTPSAPVLVLPVWRTAAGVQLFDERNPWRAAWLRIASGKGLVPLLTPLGDAADLAVISAQQALSGDPAALSAIGARYNVQAVVVAIASGNATGDTVDQVSAIRYPLGGGPRTSYAVAPRRPPEALLATAVAVGQEIEEQWKSATLVDTAGSEGSLQVDVSVVQLADWIALRKQLGQVPLIRKIDVNSLGVGAATVTLHYVGTVEQLQAALGQADLTLTQGDTGWSLRSRGAGSGAGASPPKH